MTIVPKYDDDESGRLQIVSSIIYTSGRPPHVSLKRERRTTRNFIQIHVI